MICNLRTGLLACNAKIMEENSYLFPRTGRKMSFIKQTISLPPFSL